MRTIPRWSVPIISLVMLGAHYCAAPYGVSLLSVRHHWRDGLPGLLNFVGILGVVGGVAVLIWVLLQHFERSPQGVRIGNPLV